MTVPQGKTGRPSKALTLEQANAVLRAAESSRLHAYIVLSLLTGSRTEEARALTWDRVRLEPDGTPPHVTVWWSVWKSGDTKTKRSRRTLALPPQAVEALKAHRERPGRERKQPGSAWRDRNLVCCTQVGTELDAANVRRPTAEGVDPREMRHSCVSLMSAGGVPVEAIARLVGHSSTATTEAGYRKELRSP